MKSDTIAAISTGMTNSGIGIVRISGEHSFEIIEKIYAGREKLSQEESHTIHYGYIKDGEISIDEVLVMIMRAPRTFTGEDTVEINCHGGTYVVRKVLETVIKNGARLAEPGEFTKRAFLNGKMDLSQAEAVIDVITSKNEYALQSSISQLKGSIKKKISEIRKKIIYETALIESALDDPEHYDLNEYGEKLKNIVENIIVDIDHLIISSEQGKVMKEGIQTVIVGKPNAGKSSLLNVLAGKERAIVTDIAGTTRDMLEEEIQLGSLTLNMIDTAGIRHTEDIIEKLGVEKAKDCIQLADLVIYVVDASRELDKNDEEILSLILGKKIVVLLNKTDLENVITKENLQKEINKFTNKDKIFSETIKNDRIHAKSDKNCKIVKEENKGENNIEQIPILEISAKEEQGIEQLEELLNEIFLSGEISFNDEVYITNMRQKEALLSARGSLRKVIDSIENQMPEDFYSIDLTDAYETLGSITGETIGEDLINEIFSKFCMGK